MTDILIHEINMLCNNLNIRGCAMAWQNLHQASFTALGATISDEQDTPADTSSIEVNKTLTFKRIFTLVEVGGRLMYTNPFLTMSPSGSDPVLPFLPIFISVFTERRTVLSTRCGTWFTCARLSRQVKVASVLSWARSGGGGGVPTIY